MARGHGFHHGALQVVARRTGGHGVQVAGRARVDGQGHLQAGLVQGFAMQGQQVLVDAALQGQDRGAEQRGVQGGQLRQHGVHFARGTGCGRCRGPATATALLRATVCAGRRWRRGTGHGVVNGGGHGFGHGLGPVQEKSNPR